VMIGNRRFPKYAITYGRCTEESGMFWSGKRNHRWTDEAHAAIANATLAGRRSWPNAGLHCLCRLSITPRATAL
jgi:hypothetical protein